MIASGQDGSGTDGGRDEGRTAGERAPDRVGTPDRDGELAAAIRLRDGGDPAERERARLLLVELAGRLPDDAEVAYHTAWAHDVLEREAAAVPYYERALALGGASGPGGDQPGSGGSGPGLGAADQAEAYLGLGSTYRVLGRYEDAERTLRAGVAAFPGHGGLRAFLGLALYNTGRHRESVRLLLELLARTSDDPSVRGYERALAFYAADPDHTLPPDPS
ncbi:tetratricopeptide repeat protein [Streptomyces sp. NPDC006798]|uniref:tetratricopeptide repeat protein n=1 Tax=Streptomyces sp. NPDC006798 TaxID=3155462 RepID=UPI0033F68D67